MHISLHGFVAGPNGEMNWIKVDEEMLLRNLIQKSFSLNRYNQKKLNFPKH